MSGRLHFSAVLRPFGANGIRVICAGGEWGSNEVTGRASLGGLLVIKPDKGIYGNLQMDLHPLVGSRNETLGDHRWVVVRTAVIPILLVPWGNKTGAGVGTAVGMA